MTNVNAYRQYIPDLNISIERATEAVPDDNKFYVIQDGEILRSFRSLKQAQEFFKQVVKESGYKPNVKKVQKTASQENIDRYLESKDLYWGESYKYRGGGGRGGRGGI